ncbi:MAG: MerC domain-containing protein [Proteobacteria bacterium]|nr:MerC domain-containing protein [Pseudomonadota bacterium]
MKNQLSRRLDKVAILFAGLCLVHCLVLPLVLTVGSIASAVGFIGHDDFHWFMLWLVLPVSLIALGIGCARHRNGVVAITGVIGLTLIVLVAFLKHGVVSQTVELALAVSGSLVISLSHALNYRQCRIGHCCDHDPEVVH